MTDAILQTKLYIPPLRSSRVPRPGLIARLNAGLSGRLTLLCAPAGYGKTTLVTEWLRAGEQRVAWLSLDENDNDPRRFLDYVLAGLQPVQADVGQAARAMLQSPQPPPSEVILTALVNDLAAVAQRFILVLDDYHVIDTTPVYQQLTFLLDHQPPAMHVVVITREDPFGLPLARLRARGHLCEFRQEDLRFSLEECAGFLNQVMGLDLAPSDIAALERRTEGWIAGLQLAALSLQRQADRPGFIEAFAGSHRYVLDYLIEEVFERQPAEVQNFLLKTSILDRLTAGLCDVVTQTQHSREMLLKLDKSNLFVLPLDQSRTWYRYHHLFAELLRQRLHYTETHSESELHRLASRWFAAEGFPPDAIQHALAAADWERAADLIGEQAVSLLRRGELMTLLGWFKALPQAVIETRPLLCRDYGWALSLTGQLDAAEACLRRAEAGAQDNAALLGTILAGRAYNLRVQGDNAQAIACARRALTLLPPADALSRGLVALTLGLASWNNGDYREAEQALMAVDQAARQSGNQYAQLTALAYLGMIQAVYGRLRHAAALDRRVIELGGPSPAAAPAHIGLGSVLYEWNELESAVRHVEMGIEQSQRMGNPLIQIDGYRTLALVQHGRGELEAVHASLQHADELAGSRQVSPLARARLAACHAQIALAQGDFDAAQSWAEQVTGPADASLLYPCLGLTPVRLLLARQEKAAAAERLAELYAVASQQDCGAGLVEVRALQALAADTPAEALTFLGETLKQAQPEGFVRTFVDKGTPMRALLERAKSHERALKAYILTILSAFDGLVEARGPQPLIEPMSERELQILRLLAEGLSNRAIADRLVISVGTTKAHVHHILDKMGAVSRMQAVTKAREMGLV